MPTMINLSGPPKPKQGGPPAGRKPQKSGLDPAERNKMIFAIVAIVFAVLFLGWKLYQQYDVPTPKYLPVPHRWDRFKNLPQ